MILEKRSYTPRPGKLQTFIEAQYRTGFPSSPISEQRIVYCAAISGPIDQVVHFWGYEDLGDWQSRYTELHANERVQKYFRIVRPNFFEQHYEFFTPAPVEELSPLFGGDKPWVSGDPPVADLTANPDLVVESRTLSLQPGSIPDFWDACRATQIASAMAPSGELVGVFQSLMGIQHQILQLTWYRDLAHVAAARRQRADDAVWRAFEDSIGSMVLWQENQLLAPMPIPQLAPLFHAPVPC